MMVKHRDDCVCAWVCVFTWACVLGSRRRRQPTWVFLVCMTPAPTKFAGLGSTPSSRATPKPKIYQRIDQRNLYDTLSFYYHDTSIYTWQGIFHFIWRCILLLLYSIVFSSCKRPLIYVRLYDELKTTADKTILAQGPFTHFLSHQNERKMNSWNIYSSMSF